MTQKENELKDLIITISHPAKDKYDLERQKGLATLIFLAAIDGDCIDKVIEIINNNPQKNIDEMYHILDEAGLFPELIEDEE